MAEAEPPVVAPDGAAVTADESIREEATEPVAESPAPPRVVASDGGDRRTADAAEAPVAADVPNEVAFER